MRILLDECLPRKLRRCFPGHEVVTVQEAGWSGVKNGELLRNAEAAFDVFITVDRNMEHQQSFAGLDLCIIVFAALKNTVNELAPLAERTCEQLSELKPGEVLRVSAS